MAAPTTPPTSRSPDFALLAVVGFALVWFQQMGGFPLIDPRNIGWMLAGDWHANFLGWIFTRNGPWTLPLGLAPDLMDPYGTSAAFTDAIPIASVTTKLLAPEEPRALQFFGIWLCLCVVAQAVVGLQLARARLRDAVSAALAGMIIACDPVLVRRAGHPPFFAQFVVFGLVGLALLKSESIHASRRFALMALALAFFACGVNAYLGVMAFVLALTVMLRLCLAERWFSRREALVWTLAAPVASVSSFWLFGFLAGVKGPLGQLGAEGFGQFSSDLLTFINPIGLSRLLPSIAVSSRQGEGFAYLGVGVLALLALTVVLGARALVGGRRPTAADLKRVGPILVAALVMMLYALSDHITLAGKPVLELPALYARLGNLTNVFRSSGRFSWPLHALLTLTAVTSVAALASRVWLVRGILALGLVLQVADINLGLSAFHGPFREVQPLTDPVWSQANQGYKHLYIHPVMAQWICPYDEPLVINLSWVAYLNHMTINSGLVGRNPPEMPSRCRKHLTPADLDAETVYLVYYQEFLPDLLSAGYACGLVESRVLCVANQNDTPMRRAIENHRVGF